MAEAELCTIKGTSPLHLNETRIGSHENAPNNSS
ncbi:uncharacterized protein G2W53_003830 [Senna tora]|uniref:Uncharacterized protein n=1 Tax=Senna tora TaxID=362788 RepID=A0A835CJM0_9FABA|nr:uncharacterized protein G2W53_003830 [Senna tora]